MRKTKTAKTLVFDFVINTALTVIELVTGTLSGSVALLADGFQNLTDSVVISVAFVTKQLTRKTNIDRAKRQSIYRTSGCMNALILMTLAAYISLVAYYRLKHPQAVNNYMVIGIGLLSIAVNWYAAALLHRQRTEKTLRAPYVGLIFSGFSGLGVFLSGLIAQFMHVHSVDAVVGLLIAAVLFIRSVKLLKLALSNK